MSGGAVAGSNSSAALRERLRDALEAALDRSEEQLTLAAEQAEHVRLRDADAPRDPVDRRAVQAAVRELVHGRLDQRVPALGGRDALTGSLLLR